MPGCPSTTLSDGRPRCDAEEDIQIVQIVHGNSVHRLEKDSSPVQASGTCPRPIGESAIALRDCQRLVCERF